MNKIICFLLLVFTVVLSFAEEGFRIIPILNYEFVSVEKQKYHLPGGGLILMRGNYSPPREEVPDNLMIGALHKSAIISEIPFDYTNVFHHIDLIGEWKKNRHFIQALVTSYSDKPFYGGLHTAYAQAGYGYELFRKKNINLTLGMALGISDFGFDLPNDGTWPVLPSPIILFEYYSPLINIAFSFPELKIAIAPENKFRMTGTVRLDIYKFNDIHDMLFDCIFWYRFFDKAFAYGDFVGVGLGIKNGGLDFTLGEKWNYYNTHHYSVFGILDASLLKISGGYIFYSREYYGNNISRETGKGWFVSAQILYQF